MQLMCIRCHQTWGKWEPGEDQTYYSHGVCRECTIEAIAPKVRKAQLREGKFDCFGKAYDGYCDQVHCSYYSVCIKLYIKECELNER